MPSPRASLPLALLLVVLVLPALASPVAGHAELLSSSPAANATLIEAPEVLELSFTEAVDPGTARIRLLDAQGTALAGVGPAAVDGTEVRVPLPELGSGVYTVDYQVTSAVDGHITTGLFAFLVDPTGTEPAPAVSTETDSPSSTPEATAARWVALAGALAMVGTLVFWIGSARPTLAGAGLSTATPWRALAVLGAIAAAGLVAYLLLAARPLLDGGGGGGWFPLDPAGPFGATPFAVAMRVALLGLGAATLLAVASAALGRGDTASMAAVTLGAALVGLGGMSLAGHAAAAGGLGFAAFDFLHLVGVAAWLGALVGAGILLVVARPAASAALRRHSRVALVAAPLVVLSGIANSPLVLGPEARDLVASEYGNLLLGKIVLFAVAAGLGAANFFLVRRGSLRVGVPVMAAELGVAALAVAFAAGLVTGQPAANRPPVLVASGIGAEHLYGTAGPSTVHLAVNLPAPGDQRYQVSVADAATGAYRDDVQRVFLGFAPPAESGLAPERIQLEPSDIAPGLWGVSGAYTPVIGDWELEVVVRRAGERDETVSFPLEVVQPLPPQRVLPEDSGIGLPIPVALLWTVLPTGGWTWAVPSILLAAAALVLVTTRRHRGRLLGALRVAIVLAAVVSGIGAGSRALVAAANEPPPSAVAQPNPVAATAASVARGESLYRANCVSCHGPNGSGDGPSAAGMLPPPASLPERARDMSDGALAHRIATGSAGTRMPAFAATLSERDRWDLVNYLRSRWPR